MEQSVAIIGYGTAAVNALIALRSRGYAGRVDVFSDHATLPYSPILTSYYAGGEKERSECFPWSAVELAALNPTVHANCPVTGLEPSTHRLTTPNGTYSYTKCLIATGSHPTAGGFPAPDGYTPLQLRTMESAERLKTALDTPGASILVSGTSMVAFKAVEACLNRAVPVTLLGRGAHTMRKTALPSLAARFEAALRESGARVVLGQTVRNCRLLHDGDDARRLEVEFSSGAIERFSEVLVAHGMAPNLQFVAPDTLARDDGLLVDDRMRTSDPDVYAAGDVAQVRDLVTGAFRRAGLWKETCLQGACAGRAMAAELLGETPSPSDAYSGALMSNTLHVCGITLVSGGSVQEGPDRRVEISEDVSCTVARVFEGTGATERLVGYNVFSARAQGGSIAYDIGAMLHRRLLEYHL